MESDLSLAPRIAAATQRWSLPTDEKVKHWMLVAAEATAQATVRLGLTSEEAGDAMYQAAWAVVQEESLEEARKLATALIAVLAEKERWEGFQAILKQTREDTAVDRD